MARKTSPKNANHKPLTVGDFDPAAFGLPAECRLHPELLRPAEIKTKCGLDNDLQDVEKYDGSLGVSRPFVTLFQRSVGQTIHGNIRSCSGILIGPDLFLTAGHCVKSGTPPTEVAFNYQRSPSGALRREQRFPVIAVLENRLGGLDYAILQLGNNPGHEYGSVELCPIDAHEGHCVAIIGHPLAAPKQIEAGLVLRFDGDAIFYNDVDTYPGNSGSAIIHGVWNQIVGVHTTGGCEGSEPERGFNKGVRITSLLRESPILERILYRALDAQGGRGSPYFNYVDGWHNSNLHWILQPYKQYFLIIPAVNQQVALDARGGVGTPYFHELAGGHNHNLHWTMKNYQGYVIFVPRVNADVALDAGGGRGAPYLNTLDGGHNRNLHWRISKYREYNLLVPRVRDLPRMKRSSHK